MRKVFVIGLCLFVTASSFGQVSILKSFLKLRLPEKLWVVQHLADAPKAFRISLQAIKITDSLARAHFLDGDTGGGQLDAFRHSYWMALLCRTISVEDARKLGIAHEKANYIDFLKRQKEEASLPDKAASEMDLWNNEVGLAIGIKYYDVGLDSLCKAITLAICNGEMKVIKKNQKGESLNANNQIVLNDSLYHHWNTERVLVPSHFVRPK